MARPQIAGELVIVRLTLRLRRGEDDDLIELYEETPKRKRAARTKARMRSGGVATAQHAAADDDMVDDLLGMME